MKNVIIAATIAVAVGFGVGAWFFRGPTGGDFAGRASDSQEEQMKRLEEMMRLQEAKLQKLSGGSRAAYDKLSPDERRKNREHAYKEVMDLTRKVMAEVALSPNETRPFMERAEIYARSYTSLFYDEANDEMRPEDRRRRLQEMIDVLNQDMKQILTEEHYKQYWLIVRKYQLAN